MFDRVTEELSSGLDLHIALSMVYGVGFNNGIKYLKARNKKVIQLNLIGQPIKLWNSLMEAQRATGICYQSIGQAAAGKRESAGGFKWEFPKYKVL